MCRCGAAGTAFPATDGVEGNPGSTGESGDRLAAIADERIARRDNSEARLTEAPSTWAKIASKVGRFRSRATRMGMLSW